MFESFLDFVGWLWYECDVDDFIVVVDWNCVVEENCLIVDVCYWVVGVVECCWYFGVLKGLVGWVEVVDDWWFVWYV